MRKLVTVLALCMASANPYLPVGPKIVDITKKVNQKKVDETNAKIDQAPWQISLVSWFKDTHICGGSLIGKRTVLTAAHCCDGQSASSLKVKYDGVDRTRLKITNQVKEVYIHPNWNTNTIDSDYCILILEKDVITSRTVQLIAIASARPASGTKAFLTNWGKISGSSSTFSIQLKYTEMDILLQTECNEKLQEFNLITTSMICAQNKNDSGCNGGSGGPLVVNGELVGVGSWRANECPSKTNVRPTVYADTAAQSSWIKSKLQ